MPTTEVFNEANLRKSIAGIWGEHGAHVDVFDFMVKEIARLRRIEQVVRDAHRHVNDCEEEGEGECCYVAWRKMAIIVGEARNLTDQEQAWVDQGQEGSGS